MIRALLAALAIASLGPAAAASQTKAQLDSAVPALMRAGEIPGLSAAVIRDGSLYWSGAFGLRNARSSEVVDRNTVFDAASLTKPVFAYAVLRLVDRGIIDLDKPIAELVPNPRMSHDARYLRITPRHVMSHSTGLPNWGQEKLDLSFDPGTSWGYSGEGFVWLSRAVEKVTGRTVNDVVRQEVFLPLGMANSSLVWNDLLEANGAQPHNQWGRVFVRQRPIPDSLANANAAASLRTTAEDYAKFVIATLKGTGLRPATASQWLSIQNEAFEAANYRDRPDSIKKRVAWGLGWGLERRGERTMFWHWGDNGNAKAFVIADPRSRSAVMYFANSQNGIAIANGIVAKVFPGEQGALAWIRYEQYDVPARIARRALVRAALDSGVAGVVRQYEELCARTPRMVDASIVQGAAEALVMDQMAAADTLLALGARDFPSVAIVHARADMHLQTGGARRAAQIYEQAVAIAPADSVSRARLEWAREVVAMLDNPITPSAGTAERVAGTYGPRVVTVENGQLFYQRTGGRKFQLVALANDLFTLDRNHGFRVQFVTEGSGPPTKIVGWYHDGRRDETLRTP
jgi:CubicO group peptidase (beta-lactamase class C family)